MSAAGGSNAFTGLFKQTTTLSRVVAGTLVFGYLAQLVYSPTRAYLAMVAGRTIPCGWNVVTAGLLEQHILTLAVSVMAILALSRVIEPVYGSKEYLKFLAIANISGGVGAFVTVYIAYALDRNGEGNLLYSEISGFHGVIAGLLVAVKQLTPDTEVTILQVAKLRAKHLAALYAVVATLASAFLHSVIGTVPFVLCGAYSAWFYLRFYQPSPTDTTQKGDSSADFAFATFFPAPLQPIVEPLAGAAAKLFRLDGRAGSGAGGSTAPAVLPAARSAEATRRRERGARALEERLGLKSTVEVSKEPPPPPPQPPSDIENGIAAGGNGAPGAAEPVPALPALAPAAAPAVAAE